MTALFEILAQRLGSTELGLSQAAFERTAKRTGRGQGQPKHAYQEEHAKDRRDDAHSGFVAQNDIRELEAAKLAVARLQERVDEDPQEWARNLGAIFGSYTD